MTSSRAWQLWRDDDDDDDDDEEMAKKDDDLNLPGHAKHGASKWKRWRVPRRYRRRRVVVVACGLIIAALFYLVSRRNNSSSFPTPKPSSRSGEPPPDAAKAASAASFHEPTTPEGPVRQNQPKYDGPIRYPALPSTLRRFSATGGPLQRNRNVLFAAASLRSASTLLPMACEMSMERRNFVHFAFMGVADVTIEALLEINGIDKECQLMTHDARPDHYESSTEHRTQIAIKRALYHFDAHIHPLAVFIDSTTAEEDYFLGPARDQILSTQAALIELPERPGKSLSWISKLDALALSAWNKVRFDILIHATPTKIANLERLLRSIAKADLAGIHTPHITIELPNVVEPLLESFLKDFKWPRPTPHGGQQPQLISLRRRITRQPLDEEDSSVRFVESFWPTDPSTTHVLVLAPHTEITPQFFQYVKYSLLHRLHSRMALMEDYDANLMGLAFSVPHTLIDGTTAFSPPAPRGTSKDTSKGTSKGTSRGQTAFLWQRPNSEAMLFMGDKWVELHHFISQTLYHKKTMSSPPALITHKTAGKKYPAWLEYALHLARLRGYYILYPSKPTADAVLGVHSEIPDPPEEYQKDASPSSPLANLQDESSEPLDPTSPVNMLDTLPEGGELQSPVGLPLLSWDGKLSAPASFAKEAQRYTALFRKEVGGCGEEDIMQGIRGGKGDTADDLFCQESEE